MLKSTFLLSFLSSILLLTSCKPEVVELGDACQFTGIQVDTDREEFINAMYPLHLNNVWMYRDSIWNISDGILQNTNETTLGIEQFQIADDRYTMPKFTEPSPFGYKHLVFKNDTIFSYAVGRNPENDKCFSLSPIFFNSSDTAVFPDKESSGFVKVYRDMSTITTPAGSFANCIVHNYSDLRFIYLFQQVGVVQELQFVKNANGASILQRKLSLTDYNIR